MDNVELLITLIEERPVIWDKTLEIYKNKVLRETAWREICVILKDGFEEMNEKERQEFVKIVLKKWTQVRDSWSKDIKKRKDEKKSGSSASTYKPYKYSDQLAFLKKIIDTTVGQESGETNEGVQGCVSHFEKGTENAKDIQSTKEGSTNSNIETKHEKKNSAKRKQAEVDNKIIKFLDNVDVHKQKDEHPLLHFFKSLLPIASSLTVDETLQFQAGVINLLQNIKRQRTTNYYQNLTNPTTTYYQNTGCSTTSQDSSTHQSPPPALDVQSPASNLDHMEEELLDFSHF
ncbi:madf domain transcription factor [Holotrichia oblita]|uniref:Madf domain transcription factor n=4 Tax=Holotrichia oblita TaxID=644536 RepID=A0ACB9T8Y8_HOLOL|nr:madf domain transcription factor [Holotrichia oblita]KAI4458038.1 madf domain transcription factor [Holotrichia oblita]KAI4463256.1 madf domain transcription factor [Holotrichia oblita]KAI4467061.1 madf domain transcription factor [Holotrichia oblita]